jgi:hypothetical protein
MGELGRPALPVLTELVNSRDVTSACDAVGPLLSMGPASWDIVEKAFSRGSPKVRLEIASCMRAHILPPAPKPSQEEIGKMMNLMLKACADNDGWIRFRSLQSLQSLRMDLGDLPVFDAALKMIVKQIDDPEEVVSVTAMRSLFVFGEKGRDAAIPTLTRLKQSSNSDIRKAAEDALNRTPPPLEFD